MKMKNCCEISPPAPASLLEHTPPPSSSCKFGENQKKEDRVLLKSRILRIRKELTRHLLARKRKMSRDTSFLGTPPLFYFPETAVLSRSLFFLLSSFFSPLLSSPLLFSLFVSPQGNIVFFCYYYHTHPDPVLGSILFLSFFSLLFSLFSFITHSYFYFSERKGLINCSSLKGLDFSQRTGLLSKDWTWREEEEGKKFENPDRSLSVHKRRGGEREREKNVWCMCVACLIFTPTPPLPPKKKQKKGVSLYQG